MKKCPFSTLKHVAKQGYDDIHKKFGFSDKVSLSQASAFVADADNWQQREISLPEDISDKQLEYALIAYFSAPFRKTIQHMEPGFLSMWSGISSMPGLLHNYRQTHLDSPRVDIDLMYILEKLKNELVEFIRVSIEPFFNSLKKSKDVTLQNRFLVYESLCAEKKKYFSTINQSDMSYDPVSRFGLGFKVVFSAWLEQLTVHFNAGKYITRQELRDGYLGLNYTTQLNAQSHDVVFNYINSTCKNIKKRLKENFHLGEDSVNVFSDKSNEYIYSPELFMLLDGGTMSQGDQDMFFPDSEWIGCPVQFRTTIVEELIGPILDKYLLGRRDTVFDKVDM